MKTQNERIVEWNAERQLIKTPNDVDLCKEISFIAEECLEMISDIKSEDARQMAESIARNSILSHSDDIVNAPRAVDALCDIIVFCTGAIRKLGYDPDIAMSEVLKEIESRTGTVQNGKFTKDKTPEAVSKWHTADFTKAER